MKYDIGLLIIFVIFVAIFLYRKKKNLKKEGLLFLYRTSWGIRLINKVGNKFKRTLNFLSYVVIGLGYLLMGTMLYLFGKIVWLYVIHPEVVRAIKIPPIMPLVPYLPQIFKLDFLPPFYFIYWIIIIAVIAIVHEFAHGIFAAHKKVRIKNTGFGFFPFFLPIFLAAFVELDEKRMKRKSIFSQMSVLAAGTFANIITGILFFIVIVIFFSLVFVPSGVTFDSYTYSVVVISNITLINGIALENATYEGIFNSINEEEFNEVMVGDERFLITKDFLELQQNHQEYVLLYDDAPAVNAGLGGVITKINGVQVDSKEKLGEELLKYSPGDEITVTGISDEETKVYEIVLEEHPNKENVAFLGIGFSTQGSSGLLGKIVTTLSSFRKPHTYYEPKFEAGIFIYNLLWWLVLVNISIALINMLPVGIFDGGRFFYLTVLAITKSEKKAKKAFSFITYLFLLLLFVVMAFWLMSWFK
jgi:membrane-associated protease RseP (regulator of RpoE activity)